MENQQARGVAKHTQSTQDAAERDQQDALEESLVVVQLIQFIQPQPQP